MNGSRFPLKQKKGGPKSQRIPIRRWQSMSFIVPIESALPGGKSRVCALESPAVIRGRSGDPGPFVGVKIVLNCHNSPQSVKV